MDLAASALSVSVAGCDAVTKKKLKLYMDNHPDVQLFFIDSRVPHERDMPSGTDLIVLPSEAVVRYFDHTKHSKLIRPLVIAYGPAGSMCYSIAAGCCDYLCDPWQPEELYSRLAMAGIKEELRLDEYRLICLPGRFLGILSTADPETICGRVRLSRSRLNLYRILKGNRGSYIDRETLAALLNIRRGPESRAVDMIVSRLKKKISGLFEGCEAGCSAAELICSAEGRGWSLDL